MSFREVQFPTDYSRGATGSGGAFKTQVLENAGGHESRGARWSKTRGRWDVSHMLSELDGQIALRNFFYAVAQGKAYAFRFKWWKEFCADMRDWESATEISDGTEDPTEIGELPLIGTGDSTNGTDGTSDYQLKITFTKDGFSYVREIKKPVAGTVRIWVDGVEKTITTHFTVDTTTGIVSFTAGNNPLTDEEVRAWFEHDYAVRFDIDELPEEIDEEADASNFEGIPLVEVRV